MRANALVRWQQLRCTLAVTARDSLTLAGVRSPTRLLSLSLAPRLGVVPYDWILRLCLFGAGNAQVSFEKTLAWRRCTRCSLCRVVSEWKVLVSFSTLDAFSETLR